MNTCPTARLIVLARALLTTAILLDLTRYAGAAQSVGADSIIQISPSRVLNRITPWMFGSCIEDVNHEIYGGLYDQRIFGESFAEPPGSPIAGWTGYGGEWRVADGANPKGLASAERGFIPSGSGGVSAAADAGAKLLRNEPTVGDGTVACDVRFANERGESAGLIVRVTDPGVGADTWTGYEIGLSVRNQTVYLGRHHNDWAPLSAAAVQIPVGRWLRLRVDMDGRTLRVFVGDAATPALRYIDNAGSPTAGLVGVRPWNSDVAFRNLTIAANGTAINDPLGSGRAGNDSAVSGMWDTFSTGSAQARYAWEAADADNSAHSQRIEFVGGAGTVGIANRGLNRWGIAVRRGHPMAGRLYVRSDVGGASAMVALQSADGAREYAAEQLPAAGRSSTRLDFRLVPNATDPAARFVIKLDRPGALRVDHVFLGDTGGARFHGLPCRADIGDMMVNEGLRFLRYGGSMVNSPEYRWKKMVGDRDLRPQYRGTWYPYSTNGFGIVEFVRFCEAAHIEPAFAINIDETPDDAADLVDYLNGPTTTKWGARRKADGHPAPYGVKYIEIGNEEAIDGSRDWYLRYLERFKLLYAAMRPRDSRLKFVIAAWWRSKSQLCEQIARELTGKAALWDVHVGGDGLRDADTVDRTLTEMRRRFDEWIPGSDLRACIFEENGGRHDLHRALGHARILNVTQRHGDFVLMDCPANCLQPYGQNDNGWDQGQIFFLPDRVWAAPPYYAQQMAAENYLPLRVAGDVRSPNNDLDVTVTRSEDGRILAIQVVNSGAAQRSSTIRLEEFTPRSSANVWSLSGELTAVNSPESPERVHPVVSTIEVPGSAWAYTFAPYSYTIIRLRRR